MLYSAANGDCQPWASRQMTALRDRPGADDRRGADRHPLSGTAAPIGSTALALVLVIAVDLRGIVGMGAQRWIDLGVMQLQPSEIMKIALVLALARYFHGAVGRGCRAAAAT